MDAINRRNTITCFVLSAVILVFYVLFLVSSAGTSGAHSDWHNGFLPEINADYSCDQEIYCNHDNMKSVSVMFANYERVNSGTVTLALYDETGEMIGSWEYDAALIANQTEYTLNLNEPIRDSAQKTYILRISSDSVPGEGVTLCTVFGDLLYNIDYADSSVLMILIRFCPFILIPFVFFKLRGNTWGTAYALFCIFIVAMHLYMPTNTRDDAFFSEVNNDYSLISWMIYRWNTWTSRIFQEGVGYIVVDRPVIWQFADSVMMSLLPVFVNRTLGARGYERLFALAVIPLYPVLDMSTAGWMCTTWTYMWAVFPAFVVTSILKKVMDSESLKWYEYPVFVICLVFAGNHELMAFYLLCVIVFCLIVSLVKKNQARWFMAAASAVSVITLIMFLICPGVKARGVSECYHFPGYEQLGILAKVFLGINRCLAVNLARDNHALFTVMCVIIAAAVFIQTKNTIRRVIALLPALVQFILNEVLAVKVTDDITSVEQLSERAAGITVFSFILLTCLVISIFNIYREKEDSSMITSKGILINIVLIAGLLTTAAMGFSPTIYVSGFRTSCFMYFGIIYVTLAVLLRIADKQKTFSKNIAPAVISCEMVFLLVSLLSVMGISFT